MTSSNREFVYEASSQIERLSDGFVELQREGFDRETLDDLFRQAHTLKGNCSAEGFGQPAETAHALEDLLDGLRTHPAAFDEAHVDTALEALDVLERQLMDLQTGGSVETDADQVVASIRELVADSVDAASGEDPEESVTFEDIEMPSMADEEDVSVAEALENAAVFDDLEELEGSVDATGFDDVEGVGLFDADDGATPLSADDDDADASGQSTPGGVESSTRRDSAVVPGEDSYAEMLSDTPLADPDDLQSELEDVTFGEFDDDDDLSIGELVDLADDQPGAGREGASGPADAGDRDRASVDGSQAIEPGAADDDSGDDGAGVEVSADVEAADVEGALEDDVFRLDGDEDDPGPAGSTDDTTATVEDLTDESGGDAEPPQSGDGAFEFGPTERVDEASADASSAESESSTDSDAGDTEANPVVEPLDLDVELDADAGEAGGASASESTVDAGPGGLDLGEPGRSESDPDGSDTVDASPEYEGEETPSDASAGDASPGDANDSADDSTAETADDSMAETADDSMAETADDSADDSPAGTADVVDIVDRIERLEPGADERPDGEDGPTVGGDAGASTGSVDASGVDVEAVEAGGEASADAEGSGGANPIDESVDSGSDDVSAVLDAATAATASPAEPDVLPSDVQDVDSILAETEFDDVADVEFATAEFYDRVGFETDSSTGAFVSEFDEAFDDDTSTVSSDAESIAFDASSTIDPELLDAEDVVEDDQSTSMETVREVTLDVEEADSLLELTEELVVDTQRLAGALEDLPPAAADALSSLRDVSTRIEDHVSNVRLVPLDAAFSGLSRTSRRVARDQDKEVTFLTENGDLEVDRRVVDELADPLVHLVRNAVDHGLEPGEERVANGKDPEGTVLVRAERNGDSVTVAVEDDGRGADPDALRAAAVDAGRYTTAEANALSRAEALDLMFDAGLSTTDDVSEVSGRGVGMDVVSDVVTRLEGTLDVRSECGVGTTVELTLPVSVALSDVLTVGVGSRRFGLPAADVRRVEEFVPARVDEDGYRLVTADDDVEHVPMVDLAAALDVDDAPRDGSARTDVLVLTTDPEPRAFRCQDVVDWESVVLQPFDGVLADDGLARGAALTGDGSPVVVLEPAELEGDL